jgi:hypothetical protein
VRRCFIQDTERPGRRFGGGGGCGGPLSLLFRGTPPNALTPPPRTLKKVKGYASPFCDHMRLTCSSVQSRIRK